MLQLYEGLKFIPKSHGDLVVWEFLNKKHCGNHFSFGVNWQRQIPHKSVTSADHLKQLVFFVLYGREFST
jgi:Ser-tRNA(Ala) deacylase AlaX